MKQLALFLQPNVMMLFLKKSFLKLSAWINALFSKELHISVYIAGIASFFLIISVFTPLKFFYTDFHSYVEWCVDLVKNAF